MKRVLFALFAGVVFTAFALEDKCPAEKAEKEKKEKIEKEKAEKEKAEKKEHKKEEKAEKSQLREGADGFSGLLSGKVVSKGPDRVVIEVAKIEKKWEGSKAANPEVIVGKQVVIQIKPETYAKKKEEGYLNKIRKFFDSLKAGETCSFDVKHAQGETFNFLELSEAQKKRVE